MQNKFIRLTSIAIFQWFMPTILGLLIIPVFINHTDRLNQLQAFLNHHQVLFISVHVLFGLTLYCFWDRIIRAFNARQTIPLSPTSTQIALSARLYLLAAIMFFELLVYWGK